MNTKPNWLGHLLETRIFAITIALLTLLGASVGAWINIPIEVMPRENTPPFLFVTVGGKLDLPPEQSELALAIPVEGAARTVPGVISVRSSNSGRNVNLSLTFRPKTNLDTATFNLQEALQDLESKGVLDMKNVNISRLNPQANAIIKLSVSAPRGEKVDFSAVKEELRIGLESIPEVSKVEINGIDEIVHQFEIPLSRAQEAGLEGQKLAALLQFQTFQDSLGEMKINKTMTTVKTKLLLNQLEQVRSRRGSSENPISIRELASEVTIDRSKEQISRKDGSPTIFVEIYNKDSANLFDLRKNLQNFLNKIKSHPGPLQNLNFEPVFDKTSELKEAIGNVFEALYEAILITLGIVYLFLRRIRQTLLVSLSIPVTLLLTVLIMHINKSSLNLLTLSGLILGIGMVVDNSILSVSRIDELFRATKSNRKSAALAATDILLPLLMSVITNACIFLPVAFVDGGDSFTDLLRAFQLPILACLGSSLFVALIAIPIATILWSEKKGHPTSSIESEHSPLLLKGLRIVQKNSATIILLVAVLLFFVGKKAIDIPQSDIESPRDPFSTINVQFAPETSKQKRRRIFEAVERDLFRKKHDLGFGALVSEFNPDYVSGSLTLYPSSEGDKDENLASQEARIKDWIDGLPQTSGVRVSLGFSAISGSSSVKRSDIFKLSGAKTAQINALLEGVRTKLLNVKGVSEVHLEKEENGSESLVFLPNEAALAQYGLSLGALSSEVSTSMASASLSNLNYEGKSVGVVIKLQPRGNQWTMDRYRELKIKINPQTSINLLDLGKLIPMKSIRSISRNDSVATGKLYVYYRADIGDYDYKKARNEASRVFNSENYPSGYGPPKSDAYLNIQEMEKKTIFIIGLSVFLIYLILGVMLESFFMPLAILFTIPLAILFGVVGLLLLGMDLDVMARLALVILVGSAVNSAIIMVDLINSLREQGYRREDAVVLGAAQRFKAILMSVSIQIISVLPVALGKAKILGIPYSSLGICIVSGMLFSTVVTLIILPIVYEALDELEKQVTATLGLSQAKH